MMRKSLNVYSELFTLTGAGLAANQQIPVRVDFQLPVVVLAASGSFGGGGGIVQPNNVWPLAKNPIATVSTSVGLVTVVGVGVCITSALTLPFVAEFMGVNRLDMIAGAANTGTIGLTMNIRYCLFEDYERYMSMLS